MIGSSQRKRLGQQARDARSAAEGKERQGPTSKQDTAKKTRGQKHCTRANESNTEKK